MRAQESLQRGVFPPETLLEGIMLLVGGALLLTPGFVTDAIGFTCLIPMARQPIDRWLLNQLLQRQQASGGSIIINGEFDVDISNQHREAGFIDAAASQSDGDKDHGNT